jgi:hypothetical protein
MMVDNSGDNQNPPRVLVGAGIDNNMDNPKRAVRPRLGVVRM